MRSPIIMFRTNSLHSTLHKSSNKLRISSSGSKNPHNMPPISSISFVKIKEMFAIFIEWWVVVVVVVVVSSFNFLPFPLSFPPFFPLSPLPPPPPFPPFPPPPPFPPNLLRNRSSSKISCSCILDGFGHFFCERNGGGGAVVYHEVE